MLQMDQHWCLKWSEIQPISLIYITTISKWNVSFSDLMLTNWYTMQVMLQHLLHQSFSILLYIFFRECSITANGIKITSGNGNYAQKAFIETEVSHKKQAKDTCLKCQGYCYEEQLDDFTNTVFTLTTSEKRKPTQVSSRGKTASVFSSYDKRRISGVTLRRLFLRNRPQYAIFYNDEVKNFKNKILQVNFCLRKITISDKVYSATETTLTKTPALYRCTEVIPKTILNSTGKQSWSQEDVFTRVLNRRFEIAMATKEPFLGAQRLNLSISKNPT